jgi:hypothetical protein
MRWQTPAHAIALLHLVVPAFYVGAIIRDLHLQGMTEIDHGDGGDVGNRKLVAGHEFVMRQLLIELLVEAGHAQLAALDQRRNLRYGLVMARQAAVDKVGVGVPENFSVADHTLVVCPALPGADYSLLQCCSPHQRRLRVERLEIGPNGQSLTDLSAVLQLDHRDHVVRIVGLIGIIQDDFRRDALHAFDFQALLDQKHSDTPAIWREVPVKHFHGFELHGFRSP